VHHSRSKQQVRKLLLHHTETQKTLASVDLPHPVCLDELELRTSANVSPAENLTPRAVGVN
jgi:hypothetical protein